MVRAIFTGTGVEVLAPAEALHMGKIMQKTTRNDGPRRTGKAVMLRTVHPTSVFPRGPVRRPKLGAVIFPFKVRRSRPYKAIFGRLRRGDLICIPQRPKVRGTGDDENFGPPYDGWTVQSFATQKLFDITDAALYNGIFKPKGYNSVWIYS
jgi:hypothetical protein